LSDIYFRFKSATESDYTIFSFFTTHTLIFVSNRPPDRPIRAPQRLQRIEPDRRRREEHVARVRQLPVRRDGPHQTEKGADDPGILQHYYNYFIIMDIASASETKRPGFESRQGISFLGKHT
jgi:hypothetical protein